MIKKILFAFSVCLMLNKAEAQLRVGPVGGINFNRQVHKSNTNKFDALFRNRYGFNVGIVTDLVMNKHLSLQSELLYTLRGGYYKTEGVNVSQEYSTSIGYVSLPVCLMYKINVNKAYLVLGAGPYLSKLVNTSHRFYSNENNVENGKLRIGTDYYTDQIKPWDAGVKLKAGFELKKGFTMTAFYDIGTSDINPQFVVTRNKTYGVQWSFLFSTTEEDRYNRFENFYEF